VHSLLIRDLVEATGAGRAPIGEQRALDFGCGCGRIARHMLPVVAELHGVDHNRRLVRWCERNLKPGSFRPNGMQPPLPFPAGRFDLVWAWSVFTHLPADLQRLWISELGRVVAPGGLIIFTTHGRAMAAALRPDRRAAFERGELVVTLGEAPGSNLCVAHHPPEFVRRELLNGLELLHHLAPDERPDRASAYRTPQDVYLARRPL
jgi:SAM-dependent methyltransferase